MRRPSLCAVFVSCFIVETDAHPGHLQGAANSTLQETSGGIRRSVQRFRAPAFDASGGFIHNWRADQREEGVGGKRVINAL